MSATNLKPVEPVNLGRWLKNNLFSSWHNTLLTLVSLSLIYWLGLGLIRWAFFQAQWQVIDANLRLFFIGRYPVKDIWRTWATLGVIVGLGGISWGVLAQATANLFNRRILIILGIITATCIAVAIPAGQQSSLILVGMVIEFAIAAVLGKQLNKTIPQLRSWLPLLWLLAFFLNLWLLLGVSNVKLDNLSGLILTILVAVVSIVLCFPLGVLLALGRQSNLPIIRWLSIAYIEVIRGLPLIGILFMAQVMLPLVLPSYIRPDRVVRAIAGFTIFSSAYLAENVRGGLQSIPRGQTEAAKALGLNPVLTLVFIILPQALKAVIPSIVGQFISLFKDTSLLAIVGLVDLLGISQAILANPKFLGRYGEVYLFIATIYWICCYSMSIASRKLEQQLGTSSHQGR
ncbi:neutral amino acid ABC transporter membrane protein [Stanieria cyanosphaera PCC 7437]|uniref:Neutral amino acid ABC transporter membrane protein n=1 Tax=Stanieria cyanosphaera (strain ATCC 29371 / PCC 7437) TaxID=111780 RepID=K9XN07_STAC7|nr:amino acid ABC transporter permease [Stanieria cyanosphaera]AFZ33985.1 neutral amino acid ABC transporter membrane protein [Stanieria cyanosphaera PCC 7437]